MYYIQETDKPNFIFKLFNIVKLQDNKIILPINNEEISLEKAEILANKTKKILDNTNCKKIIISKKIKNYIQYINYLNTYNCEIIDGRWLFEVLSEKNLDYIIKKKKLKKHEIQLSILVNDLSDIMLEIIKNIIKQYKKVNIVTNHIEKFKNIEEKILSSEGIMLVISNNKKKSLAKSQLILNVDFPSELINKYNIYEEAIIVNIRENIKISKKRFNGISINDYEIKYQNIEEFYIDEGNRFYNKDIYEAQLYKKQPFENIIRKINRDKVEIKQLVAINTII